jgi:hypothetical protein
MSEVIWIRTWKELIEVWEGDNEGLGSTIDIDGLQLKFFLPPDRPYRFHSDFPWGHTD